MSALIKIGAWLVLGIGWFCRKKGKIDPGAVKTILVNRTDRLGDAIISLPLLIELGKRFDMTVLTSAQNDPLIRKFCKTEVWVSRPPSFTESVLTIIRHLFSRVRSSSAAGVPAYDLYLDLVGIRALTTFLAIKEQKRCRWYSVPNMGPWSGYADHVYPRNPALFSSMTMIDFYKAFIRDGLGLILDPQDEIDMSATLQKPDGADIAEPYILINIAGADLFRGPTVEMFAAIAAGIGRDNRVLIMDEIGRPHMERFKKAYTSDTVTLLERDRTIWELLYLAKQSRLYVGSDSGITNLLETQTDAVIFFGTGAPAAWKPYSHRPYTVRKNGDLTIEETVLSSGRRKKVIYRNAWCRPCFDFGCRRFSCVRKMHVERIVGEIKAAVHDGADGKVSR